jgi:hypothetical protein
MYDTKVDVFSFGVLAWEVLSRKRAYHNLYFTADQIAEGVATRGLRPTLPSSWPRELKLLLESAWLDEPAARPEFGTIVETIKAIQLKLEYHTQLPGSAKGEAAGPSQCCVVS